MGNDRFFACVSQGYKKKRPRILSFLMSEFYLFHHLFRRTAEKQYWLTCVSLYIPIKKYGKFVHGNLTVPDRKGVLDAPMLNAVKDILVYNGTDPLERTLVYAKDIAKETKGTDRPILILRRTEKDPAQGALLGVSQYRPLMHNIIRHRQVQRYSAGIEIPKMKNTKISKLDHKEITLFKSISAKILAYPSDSIKRSSFLYYRHSSTLTSCTRYSTRYSTPLPAPPSSTR